MLARVSRAWRQPYVFALNSDWFIGLSVPVMIGQSNYFGSQVKTALRATSEMCRAY